MPEEIVDIGQKKVFPKAKDPGSFNINSFMSDIRNRGILKTNSFMVNIVPPRILRDKWPSTRNILIRCESAALPGVNFQMGELYRHGFGPQESSPHNIQFEPTNLTFLLDSQAEIYTFWYTWMNCIMNFNRSKGINTVDEYGKYPYEMGYKEDYSTEIKILMYNEAADNILQTTLLKAYPMGINEVSLNWASQDEPAKINIPISYRDFFTQTSTVDVNFIQDFISPTIPSQHTGANLIKDELKLIGAKLLNRRNSKLDRIISDILLS